MRSRSNWNFEVLVLEGRGKLDNYLRKTSRNKGENQQQTQPTYSRAPAILVGDECSSHYATLATQTKQRVYLPQYSPMHVLCDNLIIHLDPHLTSTSHCRSTKFHKEKTVCMSTASNVDKLKFHCCISCIFNHQF